MAYDQNWHMAHGDRTQESARRILRHLSTVMPFRSVVDVGCGHGHWLEAARALDVMQVAGLDGPWNDPAALRFPREDYRGVDFTGPWVIEGSFDLAICLEVAEHLREADAERLVQNLTGASDTVLFGAAIPFQGGYRHITERWQSWWAAKFASRGFEPFDLIRPLFWTDEAVHVWYRQNALVYVKTANPARVEAGRQAATAAAAQGLPLDIVHPERFLEIASYRSIAFRPLLRRFPGAFVRKLADRFGSGG